MTDEHYMIKSCDGKWWFFCVTWYANEHQPPRFRCYSDGDMPDAYHMRHASPALDDVFEFDIKTIQDRWGIDSVGLPCRSTDPETVVSYLLGGVR